jgi:hypothetical protein
MSFMVNFQSDWIRDGLCMASLNVQGQFMRNDLGTHES